MFKITLKKSIVLFKVGIVLGTFGETFSWDSIYLVFCSQMTSVDLEYCKDDI